MNYYEVMMEASGIGRIWLYADNEVVAEAKAKEMYERGVYRFECSLVKITSVAEITKTGAYVDPDRVCNHCGKPMDEGYCIGGGIAYFCSDTCLHTQYSPEEWAEMYSDDGDSYWTEWK
jgi:hypothetical protein